MKKTAEDFMQWLGIQVGDKVKVETLEPNKDGTYTKKYEVYDVMYDDLLGFVLNLKDDKFHIITLIGTNYEIIPRPKRVGDLKCGELECQECPLRTIRCDKDDIDIKDCSLYYILESVLVGAEFDQEIYDLLKARLDKEVEE